ncbi:hypothetical protein J3454_01560 [Erythrobacter sp. NFXS35]|uniref:hypothetical protein n=1 Tax=Erythrobacter sp. NFXS35 TaxID=2818436 RepID=UPI0032DF12BD
MTVIALLTALAVQTAEPPPIELRRAPDPLTKALPDRPWDGRNYSLRCKVSSNEGRQSEFALVLDNHGSAEISGDIHLGLDTKRRVLFNELLPNRYSSAEDTDVLLRLVGFDGGNLSVVGVQQTFLRGQLQSTSFVATHTIQSDGIPNSHQAMGFCFPTSSPTEATQ